MALLVVATLRSGAILPAVKHQTSLVAAGLAIIWGALYLVRRLKTEPEDLPRTWLVSVGLLIASAGWVLISALWSIEPATSAWEGLVWIGALAFLAAGRALAMLRRLGGAALPLILVVLGTVLSAVSVISYAKGGDTWVASVGGLRHAVGPFGYANAFAGLLMLTLAGTLALGIAVLPRLRRRSLILGVCVAALLGVVAVQAAALALTRSRGALAGLAAGLTVGLFLLAARQIVWSAKKRDLARITIASILALALIAVLAAAVTLEARSLDLSLQSTEQHRVQLWQSAVDTALHRPWSGWGADTFYEAYDPYRIGPPSRFAHNLFLQHWVETGIVGCTLLAFALVALLWPRWKMSWRLGVAGQRFWLWIGAMSLLIQNMVDLSLYFPALFWLFFLVVGSLSWEESPRVGTPALVSPQTTNSRVDVRRYSGE